MGVLNPLTLCLNIISIKYLIFPKKRKNHLNVESFIRNHGSLPPKTFLSYVKRITNSNIKLKEDMVVFTRESCLMAKWWQ